MEGCTLREKYGKPVIDVPHQILITTSTGDEFRFQARKTVVGSPGRSTSKLATIDLKSTYPPTVLPVHDGSVVSVSPDLGKYGIDKLSINFLIAGFGPAKSFIFPTHGPIRPGKLPPITVRLKVGIYKEIEHVRAVIRVRSPIASLSYDLGPTILSGSTEKRIE